MTPQHAPRLAGLVIVIGLLLVAFSAVLAVAALSHIPDQNALMTPALVSGTPDFAAQVEARVTAADPSRGQALFETYGCSACHALTENKIGPALGGIGQRAATRRPNYSAVAYLYESITSPNAFVVEGFPAGVMPQNFKALIPESDRYALIAWLLSK
jgi:cytochrome c oxidase subunit 2